MLEKYKIEVHDHHEECENVYYAETEFELYREIAEIMWNGDMEILRVFKYCLEDNRVEKGEIKWDEEKKRFYFEWEVVWEG